MNADNYNEIISNMKLAAKKSNRSIDDITLVAVSKIFPLEDILAVHSLGQIDFGESYVQEFIRKYEINTNNDEIKWHYIGQLQSNKVKYIVNKISMLHALDRMSLAEEMNKRFEQNNSTIDALIQVNIGDEPQKGGVAYNEVETFLDKVMGYESIRIKD